MRGCVARRWAWPGVLLVIAVIASLTPIADGDVFFHLAAGREMVARGALLRSDPFSISAAGRPWIDVHWLFQLGVYAVQCVGGLQALVLVKAALVGFGALLLCAAVSPAARPLLALLLGAALVSARHLLLVRPVIVTLVLLGWFFLQLERHRRGGRTGGLVTLPFAQLLWSNCQGLFALGPALVAAYGLGAAGASLLRRRDRGDADERPAHDAPLYKRRPLLVTMIACCATALVTPYGFDAVALPARLLRRLLPDALNPYLEVAENVPPFALERLAPGEFWHLKWFLAALAVCFVASRRRVVLGHVLVLAGLLGLALMSNRNVLLLYWLAPPIAALQLAPRLRALRARQHTRAWLRRLGPGISIAAAGALLGWAGLAAAREPPLAAPTPFRFPLRSAQRLAQQRATGGIFCADHQGGYLIWTLFPGLVPYMDTRLILRTPEEYAAYLELLRDPLQFPALQQRHGFSYAILPVAYPDRYLRLIAYLYDDPEWKLIFTNGSEVLFARRSVSAEPAWDLSAPATSDRVLSELSRDFGASGRLHVAARIQAATLAITAGAPEQGERLLHGLSEPAASALRGRIRLAAGDLDSAQRIGEQLLGRNAQDMRGVTLLAAVCMRRGQVGCAVQWLQRAAAIDPFDAEAAALRAELEPLDEP